MDLADGANVAIICSVLIAGGALIVAWWQLKGVRDELKMNSLMALLDIEAEMNSRKERVDSINSKIRIYENEGKLTEKLKDILNDTLNCDLENWFNSVDRLAYCIRKDYLKDRDYRSEYRDYIQKIVEKNEQFFGPGSKYTNIIDINEKWKRE
ncbi:hypothetical protein JW877_10375 [bacterium]|nr:hypothetical protein [bacterium]